MTDTAVMEREVERIVTGEATSDGAGVRLFRVIGGQALPEFDPFLLLDEFLSDDPNDYIAGFPEHPHRGFETVTYMLAGRMRHGDNQGNSGLLEAGSVQWMTAGRGILHSEMPEQENGRMWGFQLWVNLPASHKMMAPRYQDIPPVDVPTCTPAPGVALRLIAGEMAGIEGPIRNVEAEPVYVDITLDAGATYDLALPRAHHAFVYCYVGELVVGTRENGVLEARRLAVLSSGDRLRLRGGVDGARAIVVAGKPFNEPVARYGPFVMNTREEIMQAIADMRSGKF